MGGPWITKEVENTIIEIWTEMESKGLKPTAKEVQRTVRKHLSDIGKGYLHVPEIRKTQGIIRKARAALNKRPEHEKELDAPWTLGACIDSGISSQELPSVGRVWKLCMATGIPFSVREAKWVARLHGLVKDTKELMTMAHFYSIREKAHYVSESTAPLDTSDLDGRLTMGIWEYAVTRQLGKIEPYSLGLENWMAPVNSLQISEKEGYVAAYYAEDLAGIRYGQHFNFDELPKPKKLVEVRDKLSKLDITEFSEEAAWIYANWLTYLSTGPEWGSLSFDDMVYIVIKLREWILDYNPPSMDDPIGLLKSLVESGSIDEYPKGDATDFILKQDRKPVELLKLVGYEEE